MISADGEILLIAITFSTPYLSLRNAIRQTFDRDEQKLHTHWDELWKRFRMESTALRLSPVIDDKNSVLRSLMMLHDGTFTLIDNDAAKRVSQGMFSNPPHSLSSIRKNSRARPHVNKFHYHHRIFYWILPFQFPMTFLTFFTSSFDRYRSDDNDIVVATSGPGMEKMENGAATTKRVSLSK